MLIKRSATFAKMFEDNYTTDEKCYRLKEHCRYTSICRAAAHILKYSIPKEIHVIFHNDSNNHYHFIIKELAKESERELRCLEENTEKYKTFSVPIRKEVKIINKNRDETTKNKLLKMTVY